MPWIQQWAPTVAGWINSGLTPFVFTHSPNDAFAPHLRLGLHDEIHRYSEAVPPLPEWPGAVKQKQQRSLFLTRWQLSS